MCGTSGHANTLAGGVGRWIPFGSNPGLTTIMKTLGDPTNRTVISRFPVIGTYKYTWQTGYCSSTLTINVVSIPAAPVITSNSPVPINSTLSLSATGMTNIVSYSWTGPNLWSSSAQNPTIPNATAVNSGLYTLVVTTSTSGCQSISTSILAVITNALSTTSNSPICSGNPLSLYTTVGALGLATTYLWEGPNGFISNEHNPIRENSDITMSGTYTLTITAIGLACQYPPALITINVGQNPSVNAGSNLVILQDSLEKLRATASGDNLVFKWEPSTYLDNDTILSPMVIHPKANIKYRLTATGAFGCIAYSEIAISVPFIGLGIFTPNGDGIEDTWEIEGINNYPNCVVNIYNRWGQLIYSSIGYRNPWDGIFHGVGLPIGTYCYEIDLGNGAKPVSGYVSLMR